MADLTIPGYDKVRTVGKGAFGRAVLYKRHMDGLMVVIKEVQLAELEATERQLALNEVQVLASLSHPNIIRYIRSFEKGGSLLIEMEYADGGTLAQLLGPRKNPLSERAVLHIWSQLSSALAHMHSRGVLHRDLKTANVFLTVSLQVKVGDFGISKVLTSRAQAQTILGTPYYLSPEMCQGLEYGPKSDVWAAGCILYEMMSLRKPFDAENLPALVARIIACVYEPLDAIRYSEGLRNLVALILQRDPEKRPSAVQICEEVLPPLLLGLSRLRLSVRRQRSIVYHCSATMDSVKSVALPPTANITHLAAGPDHCLALTAEGEVHEWQLEGKPAVVKEIRERRLRLVAAGLGFSLIGSESGVLASWGQGHDGCLGHGDLENQSSPKIIEALLSVDVVQASCGTDHVLARTIDGQVFAWGKTRMAGPDKTSAPEKVVALAGVEAAVVRAGPGCSAVVGLDNSVWVWGSNEEDRLGLDKPIILGFKTKVPVVNEPTKLLSIKGTDVALGPQQALVITPEGKIEILGGPRKGRVEGLRGPMRTACVLTAGCLAASTDQVIYFWGHPVKPPPFFSLLPLADGKDDEDSDASETPKEVLSIYGPQLADLQACGAHVWLLIHTTAPLPPGHSTAAPEWLRQELRDD